GAALATFAAGNACALMFSGRLADTAGRRPVIVAGTLIGGVFTVVVGFTTALVPFLAASFVAGAGAGTAVPGLQATIGDVVGTQRSGGKVLAGFQMVQDTGAILGPVVAGVLVDVFSYQVAFTVAGLVLVLTSISWWWSRETLPIMDP
ncbi:MAG: MFS transporter, partial [Micrococcales bacterium]